MTEYRRSYAAGGTYFFTWVSHQRRPIFIDESAVNALRNAVRDIRSNAPFDIDAWVVLPNHIHCVWTLPRGDANYSKRIGQIKSRFNFYAGSRFNNPEINSASRRKKSESTIWQRRFWEHQIRNDLDFQRHVDYVHFNPVKHGVVKRVAEWPYSTFHKYCERGIYARDWAGEGVPDGDGFGE
ncbi:putative transposase [Alteromonadaceae bacterium 2753L.S.0a.02]|nr:putative transposase [Alteromonadaceae bacterium 2753L.S.0a.02]